MEQGRADRGPRLSPWARRAALAAVLVSAAGLLVQSGLLFGEDPTPPGAPVEPTLTAAAPTPATDPSYVVVRDGAQLVRYDRFGVAPGPELPAGLAEDDELYVVDGRGGAASVFGVAAGRLFRARPGASRLTDLGPASRIVDAAPFPRQLFVQTAAGDGGRVVSIDARSGQVVDPAPFAAYDRDAGWVPAGVLSRFAVSGLLLRRPGDAGRDELAVAWATAAVEVSPRPDIERLGQPGRLLGLTDDSVLLLDGSCPGSGCHLMVLTFDPEGFSTREIRPPAGWSFAPQGRVERAHGALVPVVPLDGQPDDVSGALARLVAGGENALLVRGATAVVHEAGLVESDGDVYFVALGRDGVRRVMRWQSAVLGEVGSLGTMPPLPDSARLVCVCD